ncbi:hypothetical protein PF002_g13954 [Phytophthora fragariae]|uniref:Uncharacterized protein n=1 Tax=Phytophthora fragariae TaxID=53985 RepID=A0A6A3YYD3_9STRA|nr:hypothetical protein PF002_g13954 [Phytophthora fragariae]
MKTKRLFQVSVDVHLSFAPWFRDAAHHVRALSWRAVLNMQWLVGARRSKRLRNRSLHSPRLERVPAP